MDSSLNKENYSPPFKAAMPASCKRAGVTQDLDEIDHHLGALGDMHISEPHNGDQNVDQFGNDKTIGLKTDSSHQDGRGPTHLDGSADMFRREHDAANAYFFKNCPVAGELQQLRLKVVEALYHLDTSHI